MKKTLNLPNRNAQTISISDIYGRTVAQIPVTGEKTVWQTGNLVSGVYLYHLNNGNFIATGKFMISK